MIFTDLRKKLACAVHKIYSGVQVRSMDYGEDVGLGFLGGLHRLSQTQTW